MLKEILAEILFKIRIWRIRRKSKVNFHALIKKVSRRRIRRYRMERFLNMVMQKLRLKYRFELLKTTNEITWKDLL